MILERDVACLVVPAVGKLVGPLDGESEPYELVDATGAVVSSVICCAGSGFFSALVKRAAVSPLDLCWLSVTAFAAGPGLSANLLADHSDHCYFAAAVREIEGVVPVNVSTWVLPSGVTVGR